MSTQYTPGPWKVYNRPENPSAGFESALVILDMNRSTIAELFAVGDTRDQVTPQANAHLIAAAPEMLADLEGILALIEQDKAHTLTDNFDGARLRARIAKAKGGAL